MVEDSCLFLDSLTEASGLFLDRINLLVEQKCFNFRKFLEPGETLEICYEYR